MLLQFVQTVLLLIWSIISVGVHGLTSFLLLCHLRIYRPLAEYLLELTLGVSEEAAKSLVRECFSRCIRVINGVFALLVSIFDKAGRFCTNKHPTESDSGKNPVEKRPLSRLNGSAELDERGETQQDSFFRRFWKTGWVLRRRKEQKRSTEKGTFFRPVSEWHFGFHVWNGGLRRGWVEDVHLAFEIAISRVFRFIRQVAYLVLLLPRRSTPSTARSSKEKIQRSHPGAEGGGPSGSSHKKRVPSSPTLSTGKTLDSGPITAAHFITVAGYPQESHTVTTNDGYVLLLHRLPRPNAKRTVFFQHGILDTSLGWVCSGVTDSLAFSAWDQGCDVWLGTSRSNPPRRHADPNIANDAYWRYTLNELGMQDIGAQIEHIHQIKCQELHEGTEQKDVRTMRASKSEGFLNGKDPDPLLGESFDAYSLSVVAHSLGAAAVLIYLVTSLHYNKSHHMRRIILMSPAGFHHVYPIVAFPVRWILPPATWFMEHILRKKGAPLMIPGSLVRLFVFKILRDAVQYPAIREFLRRGLRWLMNGDVSPWEFVMQLPHYDVASMPGIAVHTGIHLIQLLRSGRFQLYDYGSSVENTRHYRQPTPIDLVAEYGRIDIPVDIVAGRNDGIIPSECVRPHFNHMCDRGVNVTYREFEYGHLEFTATVGHDLQSYVLQRIFL